MRKYGLSDQVRAVARDKYVLPAMRSGQNAVTIRVKGLLGDLKSVGFPANSTPLVCNALRSERFLGDNGLEIVEVEGPPSKQSTTVVMHYRIAERQKGAIPRKGFANPEGRHVEDPSARAKRLADALRGLLKEEIREHGGSDAFIQWIRSDDEEAA